MTNLPLVDPSLLAPRPRHAEIGGAAWTLPKSPRVGGAIQGLGVALDWLAQAVGRHGSTLERGTELRGENDGSDDGVGSDLVRIEIAEVPRPAGAVGREAYRLRVSERGVRLRAPTVEGRFRGLATLVQWLDLHAAGAPIGGLRALDRPDFPTRGLLLDTSRHRVARLEVLEGWIDRLARLKVNQVHLYFEHTFAYAGHEAVWRGWSPIEPDELRRLDSFCRARFVELVAHQNSFGHFHHWLVHEPYRALAECPEGIDHPFSPEPEPFGLCATDPRSLDLLRDLYAQILPNVGSSEFAVGLDEALDLGRGRSREECERRGRRAVYLEYARSVRELVGEHDRRMQMFGDMLVGETALGDGNEEATFDDLPDDTTFLAWGYEPDHPFERDLPRFAAACARGEGRRFYVCPGTGAWNSFSGRLGDALTNLASAARSGLRHGASGYLVTDWGDHGHLQPPPISWPGWMAGAVFAWNAARARAWTEDPSSLCLAELLDRHLLGDEAGVLGRALVELGDVQRATRVRSKNGEPLFFALMMAEKPMAERRGEGLDEPGLQALRRRLDAILAPLDHARPTWAGAGPIVEELRWVGDVLRVAADLAEARLRLGEDRPLSDLPADDRAALVESIQDLGERLRPLWLARSREGGLDASIARFSRVLRFFGSDDD